MGISQLLPNLKSITRKAHVSKYADKVAAVDAYCLLHRGAHACARELVEGEPTDRHVVYCMSRIDLLLRAGVTPYVVFDGDRLPAKTEEERTRARSRAEAAARARALWAQGNRTAAYEAYQRAVDITPAVAKGFVDALHQRGVRYVVAPYEADAQMAYLALNGLVDVVITEDSDLLTYGCPLVFFKMDKGGEGEEVALGDLPQARELGLANMSHELFQEMCVMAGCDFVASLPGVGMKKAHQQIKRTRCFLKAVRALRFNGTQVPEDYLRRFQRALWTFRHQRVFCPRRRTLVTLRPLPEGGLASDARVPEAAALEEGEPDFLGPQVPDNVARAIADGDLDPIAKTRFDAPGAAQQQQQQQQQQDGSVPSSQQQMQMQARLTAVAASRPFRVPRLALAADSSGGGEPAGSSSGGSQEEGSSSREALGRPAKRLVGGLRRAPSGSRQAGVAGSSQEQHASLLAAAYRVPGLKQRQRQPLPGPTTSHFFTQPRQQQQQPGHRLATQQQHGGGGGGLLAALKAAVAQPSLDALLAADRQPSSLSSGGSEGLEGGLGEEEAGALALAPCRPPPRTPSDLRLQRSPTLDDLLPPRQQAPAPLAASSGDAALPWQAPRLQVPVAAAVPAAPDASPLEASGFLASLQQPATGCKVTPGFYGTGLSEEEEEQHLHSLPPGSPLRSPAVHGVPLALEERQGACEVRRLALLQGDGPEVQGLEEPEEQGPEEQARHAWRASLRLEMPSGTAGGASSSAEEAEEAIASLAHLPGYTQAAEAAVARVVVAACEDALASRLPPLAPPSRSLQQFRLRRDEDEVRGGGSTGKKKARLAATAVSPPSCRQAAATQVQAAGKENAGGGANPFTSFALARN